MELDLWQSEILNTKGSIVLVAGRQTGKSTIISVRDGRRACMNPNESILVIAPTERQSELIFNKILDYIVNNFRHLIKSGKDRPTKHQIKLKNGSIIRCLPIGVSGMGIRGFTISKLTIEEAEGVPDDVYAAITPMLLTTGGDMDLLGTPQGKEGFFYKAYLNKNNHYKVFHVNTEEVINNRKISPSWTEQQRQGAIDHLKRERQRMSSREYGQEYMGLFMDGLARFFPDHLIQKCCINRRPSRVLPQYKTYLGVDIARMGSDEGTFEIIQRLAKDRFIHIENIVTRKKLTTETEEAIIDLEERYNFTEINIDAGSGTLGVSVLDHLLDNDKTKRKVIAINNRSRPLDRDETKKNKLLKEDLYNNLLRLMEMGQITLLDDDDVIESLKGIQWEYLKGEKSTKLRIFGRKGEGGDHIVEGLVRAVWGASKDKRLNIWVR